MQNKFCKTCGQANFPQVTVCAKCGAKLPQESGINPFDNPNRQREGEPPPTVAVNAGSFKIPTPTPNQPNFNQPTVVAKSNKMYWIIGGIGGVLALLFVVVAAAGIVGYFYFSSSSENEIVKNYPDNTDNTNEEIDDEKNPSRKFTEEQLIEYIEGNKNRVGKYRLQSVKALNNAEYFPDKDAGVTALYAKGSKKVVHNMSMYSEASLAKADYSRYVDIVKDTKAKIVTNEKGTLIYRLEGMVFFVFCNENGGCHQLVSRDGSVISEYYKSYFKE